MVVVDRILPLWSVRCRGVLVISSLRIRMLIEFRKKGPKNTITYMIMIIIILKVSFIRFNLEDISGGRLYSNFS